MDYRPSPPNLGLRTPTIITRSAPKIVQGLSSARWSSFRMRLSANREVLGDEGIEDGLANTNQHGCPECSSMVLRVNGRRRIGRGRQPRFFSKPRSKFFI